MESTSVAVAEVPQEVPQVFVVGAEVFVKASGRHGNIVVVDDSELPYKVAFSDDGQHDWFSSENLCNSVEKANEVSPETARKMRAGSRSQAEEDAQRTLVEAQLAERDAEHSQKTRQLHDAMIQKGALEEQVSRLSTTVEALESELASLRPLLQQREAECSLAEDRRSKLAKETQALCARHVDDLQSLHAQIEEKDEVIRKLACGAESRSAAMAEEMIVLREQLESVSKCARQSTLQLRELRRDRLVKEASAAATGVAGFKVKYSESDLDDLEIGLQKGVSLDDVGLGSFPALGALDKHLTAASQMISRRADLRLALGGLWLMCHTLYMVSVFRSGGIS